MRNNFDRKIAEYDVLQRWSDIECYFDKETDKWKPTCIDPMLKYIAALDNIRAAKESPDDILLLAELRRELAQLREQFCAVNEVGENQEGKEYRQFALEMRSLGTSDVEIRRIADELISIRIGARIGDAKMKFARSLDKMDTDDLFTLKFWIKQQPKVEQEKLAKEVAGIIADCIKQDRKEQEGGEK